MNKEKRHSDSRSHLNWIQVRVSLELFYCVQDYCAQVECDPDQVVADALEQGLASPEAVGAESWHIERFGSLVPVEVLDRLSEVCDEHGWDRQSFVENALRRWVGRPHSTRVRSARDGKQGSAAGRTRTASHDRAQNTPKRPKK
jgi:hypothetical protein